MKKLKLTLCAIVALCGLTAAAQAQSNGTTKEFAGAMQLQGSYRQSDLGQLNAILNKNGLASLPDNNIWLHLSMSHIHKNWIFEDGLGGTFTSTSAANATNGIRSQYNQFEFFTRAGYNISKSKNVRFYPFIGINLLEGMLRIQDKNSTQSTSDFSTEILKTSATKTIWNPNLGFDFGVGYDYVIKLKPKQTACYTVQRNIPIGLRVGYYLQATNTQWKIDDNFNLNNGPSNKQSAIFVTLNVGLGYSVKK
jgi:hypothetical protein